MTEKTKKDEIKIIYLGNKDLSFNLMNTMINEIEKYLGKLTWFEVLGVLETVKKDCYDKMENANQIIEKENPEDNNDQIEIPEEELEEEGYEYGEFIEEEIEDER